MKEHLRNHEDRNFAGLKIEKDRLQSNGILLVCNRALRKTKGNAHQEVVSAYLGQELKQALAGEQEMAQQLGVHVNPIGVIPKGNLNKWRLILDLSVPTGWQRK